MSNKRFRQIVSNDIGDKYEVYIYAEKNQVACWSTKTLENMLEATALYLDSNKDKKRDKITIIIN